MKTKLSFIFAVLVCVESFAISLVVPGTADPWLANAAIDNVGTPEPPDTAPGQSPIFARSVSPGDTISWSATGLVGHPGEISGPDGAASVVNRFIGAANGIADITAPINALIGVWEFPGGGTPFFMGSSGSATAPAGATGLFLGVMDGYGWANNIGSYTVNLHGVPDGGSTILLLALGCVGLATRRLR